MGQSLSQLYVHLTFGTQDRLPFIKAEWNPKLHAYISGILKNMESPSQVINSVQDHVHILFRLSKNYALAKVAENVKKESSKWVKSNTQVSKFSWQSGYGAFSVSSSKVEAVHKYILNQENHHKKQSFKDEIEEFLKCYDIMNYDEKYFWVISVSPLQGVWGFSRIHPTRCIGLCCKRLSASK